MVSQTNEQAFEATIEKALTGSSLEERNTDGGIIELPAAYGSNHNGYQPGLPASFNAQYAIDEHFFWRFLETTQKPELGKLSELILTRIPVSWRLRKCSKR